MNHGLAIIGSLGDSGSAVNQTTARTPSLAEVPTTGGGWAAIAVGKLHATNARDRMRRFLAAQSGVTG
jgi:hypothetical protein